MRPGEKVWFTDRCPWGQVHADPLVRPLLHAHARLVRFGVLPPGRGDPRTEVALHILGAEHDLIDAEALKKSSTA